MTDMEIFSHVDHTQLKAVAAWESIEKLCHEAEEYQTASVCIPPAYVKKVRRLFPSLNICTVIGFPLGYNTTEVKVFEAKQAVADGADEIDMVINIGFVKNGDYADVTHEISEVREAVGDKILKVIVETCYLNEKEKRRVCGCVTDGGADYIKTSTGFGTSGATLDDIALFRGNVGEDVKIKAAGGIRTREEMEAYLAAGCDRIGTSGTVAVLTE